MLYLIDKYVDPLTDFGFKKLFGEEPNKDILIAFLNEILPERRRIEDLTFGKNETLGTDLESRKAIFDLYCVSASGERFIVELQKAKQNYFKDRSVFYSSFPIREQAQRGNWDFRLHAVYTIGILDFIFDDHKDDPTLLHLVELKNQRNEVFYDKLKYIYIELPKFTKTLEELESNFEKWLYVFRHLAYLDDRPAALQERIFEKLFEVAQIANFTPQELEVYEDSLKHYRDLINVENTSRAEGKAEGIAEGIKKGEQNTKLAIARSLLQKGMTVRDIAEITNLSTEAIESLNFEE